MGFKDLREYIDRLEKEGELLRIKEEVDWNLEIGAIIRRSYDLKAPAPLFENIKDYRKGYSILGAPAGVSNNPDRYFARVAISLGMDPGSKAPDIIEEYIKRKKNPIKPIIVNRGPCKENIHIGDDVNLFNLPAPIIHEGDGGRYIGTWHIVVTKDPDSEWVNWGMYRLMIHDERSMGGVLVPPQHIGKMYYEKYEPRNKPMEFAVAIGGDPVIPIVGCAMMSAYVNEVDIAGALREEPVQLVKCETVNLYVPASSEIVIEGEVLPYERKEEGPFGEYVGYRASEKSPKPVYRVKAITHRNDPILTVSNMGVPIDDCHAVMPLTMAAEVLDELRTKGIPVKMVYLPPEGVSHMIFVSTKVPYPNFAKKVANAVWATTPGTYIYYVVVVDDDVDVTNIGEVIHAFTTRCHPYRGIYPFKDTPIYPLLIPFLSPENRLKGTDGGYVLFDCTWPKDWAQSDIPIKASFDILWPNDIQEKVLEKWNKYGYK